MTATDTLAEEARQNAAKSGVGYANAVGVIDGRHVEVCAFRTARSAKYQLRWTVNGKSVPASRLAEVLA